MFATGLNLRLKFITALVMFALIHIFQFEAKKKYETDIFGGIKK